MFGSLFSVFSASLLLATNAAPAVKRAELLAVAPPVTYPDGDTLWFTNTIEHVDWDTSKIPEAAENYTVNIYIGFRANNSENLDLDHPLATKIPIMDGTVSIEVPEDLTTGTDYLIAVFGDSGNVSPPFSIISAA